jgi:hypothetical protein
MIFKKAVCVYVQTSVLPQIITGVPRLSNFKTQIILQNIKNEHVFFQ